MNSLQSQRAMVDRSMIPDTRVDDRQECRRCGSRYSKRWVKGGYCSESCRDEDLKGEKNVSNYVNGNAGPSSVTSAAPVVMSTASQHQDENSTALAGFPGIPLELVEKLYAPLPPEAIQPHPTKGYLSTIKTIFVVERLNQVFGMNGWRYVTKIIERGELPPTDKQGPRAVVVMKVVLRVPAYGIRIEQYGGSENEDWGDAYKGAVTDAISKIASYLGIAIDVYKGGGPTKTNPRGRQVAQPQMQDKPKHTPAQARVADEKIAGLKDEQAGRHAQQQQQQQGKPPASEQSPSPWSTRGEARDRFAEVREQIGEVAYFQELAIAGVKSPEEFFPKRNKEALACYYRMQAIHDKREVA